MDNEKKYTTTLRLYKERPAHAQAYRCLKNYNTDIFRTKDDFIAEAVIHFSRYLKQEEEEKQLEGWNHYLEQHSRPLLELVKKAVMEVQMEQIPEMIKGIVGEAVDKIPAASGGGLEKLEEAEEKGYSQRDIQFAQFYDFGD